MLAQNFMTAADLGISEDEHSALLAVLGMMERGEIVDVPRERIGTFTGHNGFNMSQGLVQQECGSVGCVVGWARELCPGCFSDLGQTPKAALALFTPRGWSQGKSPEGKRMTVRRASMVLRNYLTAGDPRWSEVTSLNR